MPLQAARVDVIFSHAIGSRDQHQYWTGRLVSLTIVRSVDSTNRFHIFSVTNPADRPPEPHSGRGGKRTAGAFLGDRGGCARLVTGMC